MFVKCQHWCWNTILSNYDNVFMEMHSLCDRELRIDPLHLCRSKQAIVIVYWGRTRGPTSEKIYSGCCMAPSRDNHGVFRSCYSTQLLPIEGAHETENTVFSFRAILPWGLNFSEVGLLVLSQLAITIVLHDLHRCSGSILSFPIPQENNSLSNSRCKIKDAKGK